MTTFEHNGETWNTHQPGDPNPTDLRKNVTVELPEPRIDQWDAHCLKHQLSRAQSLAKWLKWKKPGKKK